jgi:ribonuclease HI
MFIINTDGACSGNPGKMGIGAVISKDGKILAEISEAIGDGTNNIAEYTAVIRALEEARKLGVAEATIRSDSLLLISQLKGEYKVKAPHLRELRRKITKLSEGMKLHFEHVPREKNAHADELSKLAIGLKP